MAENYFTSAAFCEALRQCEENMGDLDRAKTALMAIAAWSDRDLENPIIAKSARMIAVQALEKLP